MDRYAGWANLATANVENAATTTTTAGVKLPVVQNRGDEETGVFFLHCLTFVGASREEIHRLVATIGSILPASHFQAGRFHYGRVPPINGLPCSGAILIVAFRLSD